MKLPKNKNIIIAVVLVVSIGAFLYWANSDNEVQITQGPDRNSQRSAASSKDLDGKYVKFTYPGTYFVKSLEAKNNDLELYKLIADTVYEKQLVVAVSQLNDGELEDNSAYLLRKTRTDMYTKRTMVVADLSVEIWAKTDGREEAVFIRKDNRVATLVFTTGINKGEALRAEVDAVLRSFRWVQ